MVLINATNIENSMDNQNATLRLVGKPRSIPGFTHGARFPSLLVGIEAGALCTNECIAQVNTMLSRAIPLAESMDERQADEADSFNRLVLTVLHWMHQVQVAAGLPVMERGRIVGANERRALVCIPTMLGAHQAVAEALVWLVTLVNFQTKGSNEGNGVQSHMAALSDRLTRLNKVRPSFSNVPRFVRAAYELGMPIAQLPGQLFQYGHGKRARWMYSSFTDATPNIAAQLARNKLWAAAMLQQAGIPVPAGKLASDVGQAVQIAEQLGYPVVVKPVDLDGGLGVAAGLLSAEEVKTSFQRAQAHSRNILVEKHVEGKDYRVTVFQDEVIWAIERVPGGVTGDGRSTVRELVERLNADPRRGEGTHAPLKRLVLDEEASALLRRAGLDDDSVPADGRFLRLRSAANVASGGTPVPVFDRIHPDNRYLAIRAAQALRLDLAGVDLLIPDISESWRQTGAAICEVNAQPSVGQNTAVHLYAPILRRLVPGNGRIPIAVVLGAPSTSTLVRDLERRLVGRGIIVGCHDRHSVSVNGETVLDGSIDPFTAGQLLIRDRAVAAVVLSINDFSVLQTGLPFARFDVLVLAGTHITAPGEQGKPRLVAPLRRLLAAILPACDGKVVEVVGSGLEITGDEHITSAKWVRGQVSPGKVVDYLVAEMLAADETHEKPVSFDVGLRRPKIIICVEFTVGGSKLCCSTYLLMIATSFDLYLASVRFPLPVGNIGPQYGLR